LFNLKIWYMSINQNKSHRERVGEKGKLENWRDKIIIPLGTDYKSINLWLRVVPTGEGESPGPAGSFNPSLGKPNSPVPEL